jgi:hypothetical protein
LEETHADKRHRRDVGVQLGHWILGRFKPKSGDSKYSFQGEEANSFIPKEKRADIEAEGECVSSVRTSLTEVEVELPCELARHPIKAYSWRETFSNQVLFNILGLGVLAL